MNYLTNKKFSFTSDALAADTFGVVKFTGTEGVSQCYTFEVMLVSDNLELDLEDIIENPAKLTFHRDEGDDVSYHGILLSFEQLHEFNKLAFYRAHLVPRLTWLSFTRHNQVFLDKTVPEVVEACLKDGGLTGADFEMRLKGSYDAIEYICQYGESHLNFIARWCEREGIYYFFEQSDAGEKVIFTDTQISHTPYAQGDTITYSPPSGLEAAHEREIVRSFYCRVNLTPQSVLLKDYNYRKPSLDVSGSADVDAKGRGQVYSWGDHIRTPEEGNRIAKIKAEALLCKKEVFHGEGSVPYMMPGYTFTLKDHYRGSFNQSYLVTDVSHEGNQTGYLLAGITKGDEDRGVFYRNSFSSIVSTVQFRPEPLADKPRISGTLTAKIDAAGSGEYAELDSQGRYTAILPFDISGRKDGKASAPLRMAQPYAGSNHGMHFPLHKGTEVLLTFIDGDPDRPIIQSAVPNPETSSPVNVNNQTMSAITTASGNQVHFEDKSGTERILMHSPKQKSFVRVGAPNDPSIADPEEIPDSFNFFPDMTEGIKEATKGAFDVMAGLKNQIIFGPDISVVAGLRAWFTLGILCDATVGWKVEISKPEVLAFKNFHVDINVNNIKSYLDTFGWMHVKWKFRGVSNKVAGTVNTAVDHDKQQALAAVQTYADHVDADLQHMEEADSSTKASADRLDALALKVQTVETRVHDALDEVQMHGANQENIGVHVTKRVQKTKMTGINLQSGGMGVNSAITNEQV